MRSAETELHLQVKLLASEASVNGLVEALDRLEGELFATLAEALQREQRAPRVSGAGGDEGGDEKKEPLPWGEGLGWGCRRRPTLPGRLRPSTIGAEGLNGRVRDGSGWGPLA